MKGCHDNSASRKPNPACLDGTLESHEYSVERNGNKYCCYCGRPKTFMPVPYGFEDKKFRELAHKLKGENKVIKRIREESL